MDRSDQAVLGLVAVWSLLIIWGAFLFGLAVRIFLFAGGFR
ncbi:MAG TPA: hypothetical protein VFB50_21310 [Chloroflexota bacterium]|nr:hypothetical protein [Chloroflexota bacterium]